uniref:C-type lectin domain-containing protein n=1 Tax=Cyprinus carpio TaxID=7962 RepID=A0A8C1IBW8_CYPCA
MFKNCHFSSLELFEVNKGMAQKMDTTKRQRKTDDIYENVDLTNERDELIAKNDNLIKQRDQTKTCFRVYILYKQKLLSDRGGDLIIRDNREEQNISGGADVWIGLTEIDVEGRWKWVDGSTLTSGFWWPVELNGQRKENCALNNPSSWADYPCNDAFKWVCEKSILHYFTLNIY